MYLGPSEIVGLRETVWDSTSVSPNTQLVDTPTQVLARDIIWFWDILEVAIQSA